MKIIEGIQQGSPEWRALRAQVPVRQRSADRHGRQPPHDSRRAAAPEGRRHGEGVQRLRAAHGAGQGPPGRGAGARHHRAARSAKTLYPATALDDAGEYLASLDGITMAEDILMEHKQWNEELAAAIRARHRVPRWAGMAAGAAADRGQGAEKVHLRVQRRHRGAPGADGIPARAGPRRAAEGRLGAVLPRPGARRPHARAGQGGRRAGRNPAGGERAHGRRAHRHLQPGQAGAGAARIHRAHPGEAFDGPGVRRPPTQRARP
jgi:hypothetical protein